MINIAVDVGNSRIKVGMFDFTKLVEVYTTNEFKELPSLLDRTHDNLIVSTVQESVHPILSAATSRNMKLELKAVTPLPIINRYSTAGSLGVDRIADACGALQLFPGEDCLVIDLGTCINYELLDRNKTYWGGMISPGVNMRFKSMNAFTARLPLVEPANSPKLVGDSTTGCLQSGVMNGILEEMNGIIENVKRLYPSLRVITTGGDSHFFENQTKHSIFAAPELALIGLNGILMHNVAR